MRRLIKLIKSVCILTLAACLAGFVYFSISVSFPVLMVSKSPSLVVHFLLDKQGELFGIMRTSSLRSQYRFAGHEGLNPIFIASRRLFDKPKDYVICFNAEDRELGLPLLRQRDTDWFTTNGWSYYLNEEYVANYLLTFPKDVVVSEAVLVEGKCANRFNDNSPISEYAFFYDMPDFDSYRLDTKIFEVSFNEALEEAESRAEFDAGFTQLNDAVSYDCLECVKELVSNGVNPNGPIRRGPNLSSSDSKKRTSVFSSLKRATQSGREEIAEYLISQGAEM